MSAYIVLWLLMLVYICLSFLTFSFCFLFSQVFLFTNHLLITTRGSNGRLHLTKVSQMTFTIQDSRFYSLLYSWWWVKFTSYSDVLFRKSVSIFTHLSLGGKNRIDRHYRAGGSNCGRRWQWVLNKISDDKKKCFGSFRNVWDSGHFLGSSDVRIIYPSSCGITCMK